MKLDEVPLTLPPRREMFGRLSPEQRRRRLVEDVLVGLGLLGGLHAEPGRGGSESKRAPGPPAAVLDQAVLARRCSRASSTSRTATSTWATRGSRCSRSPTSTCRRTGSRKSVSTSAASRKDRSGGAKGAVEAIFEAGKVEATFERGEHRLLHPGKTATTPYGALGELRLGI